MVHVRKGKRLTEIAELQTQIETAIRDLEENHKKAAKTMTFLKKRINDLELSISNESCVKTDAGMERLNSATQRLDRFVDSVILENAHAMRQYERFERECRALAFESVRLEDFKALCQEYEQLAKDLLCYSLGHIRPRGREVK